MSKQRTKQPKQQTKQKPLYDHQHSALFDEMTADEALIAQSEATTQAWIKHNAKIAEGAVDEINELDKASKSETLASEEGLATTIEQLRASLEERDQLLREKDKQISDLTRDYRHVTEVNIQLEKRLQRLDEENEGLKQDKSDLRDTILILKQSQVEVERLNAELAQKQAEAKTIQVETQQKIQQTELEVTQLKAQITNTQNLITTAEAKLQDRYLYSPIDGVISALNVFNVGEVIQPGQTVAEITPKNAPLILTASLPNDKAGFVKTGMSVKVKFDAYPYQNYGVFEGTVRSISPDTKVDKAVGPVYKLEIVLKKDYVLQQDQKIQLKSGQTASADIIIRRRRIMDILLNPILQLQKNGIDL